MTSPHRDTIEHWVGDFCTSTSFVDHPSLVREYAPEALLAFGEAACRANDRAPADWEEADMRPGLVDGVARVEIPGSVREGVPDLCSAFLAEMEAVGRLSGGKQLGLYVRALRKTYLDAAAGKGQTIVAPAVKVGRNDPCPCGSGRKYKKCCQGTL